MREKTFTLIHVPHSSVDIPGEYLSDYSKGVLPGEIKVMTDWYCHELFDVSRNMLVFPVSRLVCDVERFREDKAEAMSEVGMGWYYTKCSGGALLRKEGATHKEEILSRYYDRHHKAFEEMVGKILKENSLCLIIDGHSFFPRPLPYEKTSETQRADICIGADDFHTPKELICASLLFFKGRGYSVSLNKPFAGAIVPMAFYKKDKRVHSIMLEINRSLYMNENTDKNDAFAEIKKDISEWVRLLEEISVKINI